MEQNQIDPAQLERLRLLSSCAVSNAIETFGVRLFNTGFTDSSLHCIFPKLPPMVGYAATVRIRTSEPPMEGERYFYRLDWLDHALSVPAPRILVLQDLDSHRGLGAFVGDIHVNILLALGFVGIVTNGAVRKIDKVKPLEFQMFAGNLSVSHAYAHIVDFGTQVEVAHMHVQPGDLVHGDVHGVQTVPLEIAEKVPGVAERMIEEEQQLIELCHSPDFDVEKLRAAVAALRIKRHAMTR